MNKPKKQILIIEDDLPLLQLMAGKFVREGFAVLEAKNGQEGLELALKEHPDLILLDIRMPEMDGMTMLKKLRVDSWGKSVSVIILTNLDDGERAAEALESGVSDYLIKTDCDLKDVVKKVKEKIGK